MVGIQITSCFPTNMLSVLFHHAEFETIPPLTILHTNRRRCSLCVAFVRDIQRSVVTPLLLLLLLPLFCLASCLLLLLLLLSLPLL